MWFGNKVIRSCEWSLVILKANPGIEDVDMTVCRKRELFRIQNQSGNEEDRKKYCKAKTKDAKRVVYTAIDQKAWEVVK